MRRERRSTKLRDRTVRRNGSSIRRSRRRRSVLRRQALSGPGRRSFASSERGPWQSQKTRLPPGPRGRRVRRRTSRPRVKRRRPRRRRTRARESQHPGQRHRARLRRRRLRGLLEDDRRTGVRAVGIRGASVTFPEHGRPLRTGSPPVGGFRSSSARRRLARTQGCPPAESR